MSMFVSFNTWVSFFPASTQHNKRESDISNTQQYQKQKRNLDGVVRLFSIQWYQTAKHDTNIIVLFSGC